MLEFDAPNLSHCLGVVHTTLTSVGIKPHGEPYPLPGSNTEAEAWIAYGEQLAAYTKDAEQLAWRAKPFCVSENGQYYIFSRLSVYR